MPKGIPSHNEFTPNNRGRGRGSPLIQAKVSQAEKDRIKELAASKGLNPSQWQRVRCLTTGPFKPGQVAALKA